MNKKELEKERLKIEELKLKLWKANFKDLEVLYYIDGCTNTIDWCKDEAWFNPYYQIELKIKKSLGEKEFKRIIGS